MDTVAPKRRRWTAALLGVLVLVALWGVLGGLVLPAIAKRLIAQEAGEALGRTVTVERVSVNPYTLDASLEGLRILEADRATPFVTFDRLDVEGSAASFYKLAPVVDRLTLTGLKAHLVRDADNHYNVTDILQRLEARAKARAAEARRKPAGEKDDPPRFSVSNIRLANASVEFDDRPVNRRHQVTDIQVAVPFVSNLPRHLKEYVAPSFAAKVNGAPVLVTGETKPFQDSLATHFTLDVNALDVRRYLAYVPMPIPARVDSGTLDAHVTVRFTQGAKAPTVEAAGTAALSQVSLTTDSGKLLRFARLEAKLGSLDPLAGKARIDAVRLEDASGLNDDFRTTALEAGGIELDLRAKTVHVASVATRDGAVSLRRGKDGSLEMPALPSPKVESPADGAQASAPWKLAVDRATLTGYDVTLADAAVRPAATHKVRLASVEATELANEHGLRGKATARVELAHGGSVDVDSTFALEPLLVTARVDAKGIDLVPLRPYMNQFQTVQLRSGAASARGELTLKAAPQGLRIAYNGGAELSRFFAYDTAGKEDLLRFRSIKTSGVVFSFAPDAPLALAVGDIVVDKVYSRLVVLPEGRLNVQQLRTATPEAPDAPAQAIPDPRPRDVRIDRITFVDGRLNFTDHFIRPNYSADVGELQGTVTGLSSSPESRANVDLKGRYDGASPVIIAGTVNPLRGDLFADIAAKGQDIQLPRLTAYSQRYAGYGITEGRLTLDVKYHVEDGKLDGRNNITVDQLTFGDKVDSPDAIKLPILFAVNLLKDSDGRIALELPISGSLEDPKFEIGAVITQVLGQLLKKAVTSPFSLLAAAFGSGGGDKAAPAAAGTVTAAGGAAPTPDDLAFIDFAPGQAQLDATDERKLQTMARALKGRPGLTLEMAPRLDAERDLKALRWEALHRMVAGGGQMPADAAYPAAVRAAYAKAKLPGDPDQLSVAAMETALMDKAAVGQAELDALKQDRGARVRAWLLEQGQLPAARVVMAEASADAPEAKAHASRVDFALR
jgi:hypothetical protein